MPNPPFIAASERFAGVLRGLTQAVVAQTLGGPLSQRLIGWITIRITCAIQRVADLASRVAAGAYTPRRVSVAPRRQSAADAAEKSAAARPASPPLLGPPPKPCGWLVPLLPYGGAQRAAVEAVLRDPGMVALMQAAPAPIARVLRPLCWMLALDLPPALARRKAAPIDATADPSPATKPKPPRPRRPRVPPLSPPWRAPQPPAGMALQRDIWGRVRIVWT